MSFKGIIDSASRLKQESQYLRVINESTRDILLQLNSAIRDAHMLGAASVSVDLPINFANESLKVANAELQTAVYYNVVTELERNQYTVHLRMSEKHTVMDVSWAVRAEVKDVQRMQRKLAEITYGTQSRPRRSGPSDS